MRLLLFTLTLHFTAVVSSQELPTVPVTVKPLSEVLIERKLTANAQVKAKNSAQLAAEVTAVVKEIHVDVGQQVNKGDELISLDATDWRLQAEQATANKKAAQARLQQAQIRLDRAQELKTSQYISADDLLARETDVAVLKADLLRLKVAEKTALRQVKKTQIVAPFTGVVTARQAQVGQLLTAGSPVLNLVQLNDAEIHAKIPSHTVAQLSAANRFEFSDQNQTYPLELIQLTPVIESQAAVQSARFKTSTSAPTIGQTGQLVWYLTGRSLSADLITKRNGQLGVFIAQNNRAKFMPLSGAQEGRPADIAGQHSWQVIIGGRERLQDGQPIKFK